VLIKGKKAAAQIGLIEVPDTAKRDSGCQGTVIALGNRVTETLPIGSEVAFESVYGDGNYAPRFRTQGDDYYIVPETKVTAVVSAAFCKAGVDHGP